MCGIAGVWNTTVQEVNTTLVREAARLLSHRGPDDEGFFWLNTRTGQWTEDNTTFPGNDLAFGFRRLSILDLSSAGHQPMSFADGKYWIVFNGEIYNYVELREELSSKGYTFRSGTDTEVILAAYIAWGEDCLSRFVGMWAFVLWDGHQHKLFCARDRFGIKPLYYTWQGGRFAFASEIKALLLLMEQPACPKPAVIYDFLANGWSDHLQATFFQNVQQLLPGHYLTLKNGHLATHCYWTLNPDLRIELSSNSAYAERFFALFEDAIRVHLRSDVAIGTCLSGGLDSSSIVQIANRLLAEEHTLPTHLIGERQKTFSACFDDTRFDERVYIEQILAVTGAEANYVFPSGSQLIDVLPKLIWHQDEPIGSTSLYAQWCVMERVAERGVRVLLDGQGADESLAGYHYYFHSFWAMLAKSGQWGAFVRELSAYRAKYPVSWWSILLGIGKNFAPSGAVRWARQFRSEGVNLGALGINPDFGKQFQHSDHGLASWRDNWFENQLHISFMKYSLPALLRYEDRNSMAHSVEARVPFLDHRLVEFIFGLPVSQKIHDATTKVILRRAMQGILPERVRQRQDKMGFVTPEKVWLKAELGEFLRDIVHSPTFIQRGYLDIRQIQRMVREHKTGQRDISFIAIRWLSLELWFRQFIDGTRTQAA